MLLFPAKSFTGITSDTFDSMRSKAITHSLDEIGGEFF
jgi:hypothetical protein